MGRLLVLVALAVFAYQLVTGRWPWQKRVSARERTLSAARARLGVAPQADRAEILAAHRRLLATAHPDHGGSESAVHEANTARDLLLAALPSATHPLTNYPEEPS